jgi:hypothetical protein
MERRREGSLLALPIIAVLAVTPILAEVKVREVGWADRPPGIFVGVADRDASAVNGTVTATASQMCQGLARPGGMTTLDSEAPSSRFGTVTRSGSEARSEERRLAAEPSH